MPIKSDMMDLDRDGRHRRSTAGQEQEESKHGQPNEQATPRRVEPEREGSMGLVLSHATFWNSEGVLVNVYTGNTTLAAPGTLPVAAAFLLVYCTGMCKG